MLLEMTPTSIGRGGSFIALAGFDINSIGLAFENIDVKIDTGCSVSTLSMQRYRLSGEFCKSCKEQDIKNNIPYMLSYGVETGGRRHSIPVSYEEKMDCTAMKFLHGISHFVLERIELPVNNIYINYDRANHMLIGMDILDKLDIHMGESKANGKQIFLACPKNEITADYQEALEKHFGLTQI